MSNATFIKYLFNVSLNGLSVAKYGSSKNYGVMLKVESSNPEQCAGYGAKLFRTEDDYEAWVDSIVDEQTQFNNKALALRKVLDSMMREVPEYPFEDNNAHGE